MVARLQQENFPNFLAGLETSQSTRSLHYPCCLPFDMTMRQDGARHEQHQEGMRRGRQGGKEGGEGGNGGEGVALAADLLTLPLKLEDLELSWKLYSDSVHLRVLDLDRTSSSSEFRPRQPRGRGARTDAWSSQSRSAWRSWTLLLPGRNADELCAEHAG